MLIIGENVPNGFHVDAMLAKPYHLPNSFDKFGSNIGKKDLWYSN